MHGQYAYDIDHTSATPLAAGGLRIKHCKRCLETLHFLTQSWINLCNLLSFAGGSRSSNFRESISIPKNVRQVVGPSTLWGRLASLAKSIEELQYPGNVDRAMMRAQDKKVIEIMQQKMYSFDGHGPC